MAEMIENVDKESLERTRKEMLIETLKEPIKNILYNKHAIGDFDDDDPLVSMWLSDFIEFVIDVKEGKYDEATIQ